jgi:alpha-L-rhamnosidase
VIQIKVEVGMEEYKTVMKQILPPCQKALRGPGPRLGFNLSAVALTLFLVAPAWPGRGAGNASEWAAGFLHPPAAARPWVYWFPLDGNISSNGITADLEAMQRVGIGGVLYMETEQGTPKGPAKFAGPLWRALFKHACAEANRLGLEVNMNNDAGWCGSGGPWITPELSMQKVVFTETSAEGPRRFDAVLSSPPAVANFYRDIAVLAFPTPAGRARIENIRGKAVFTPLHVSLPAPAAWPTVPADQTIPRDRIVDLTGKLGADGRLKWEVPAGTWTILRFGHTTTGQNNLPAPSDGRGLECDKMSKEAVDAHFAGLMGKLIADVGPLAGRTLVSTHIDSWEVNSQNWTPRFREEFRVRRGYDMLKFLPVMTGRVVESIEVSERFLWDLRETISELVLRNYAGHFRELAHRHGMRLSIEAYTTCPTDEMEYAGRADEPMGEFWSWSKYGAAFSCTEMASAAHVYGKRIVGAEAFTASNSEKWLGHPANIKDLGDWAFCEGINRFVFHRYALQPWADVKPGISMGPWGLHYERTQTWWEQSKAWHEYLARCQFLLRQGLFVADICLLGPEGSPQTLSGQQSFTSSAPGWAGRPLERPGYNFDTCPPEVALTRMTVKDGRLVLPDGMSYRVLALPQVETMTPLLLAKITELVKAGATVIGAPPLKSPSLSGYPKCDREVAMLAAKLWGVGQTPRELTARPYGKGQVVHGRELEKNRDRSPGESRLGPAQWIWFKEGNPAAAAPVGKRYFRRIVNVEAGSPVASARLVITADNSFTCWVNGQTAGSGDTFNRTYRLDVARFLKPGPNVIAVEAENASDHPNPAGLIAALTLRYQNGRALEVRTDKDWESARAVQGAWTSDATSTAGWSAALELGPLGMDPWGDVEQSVSSPDLFPDVGLIGGWLRKTGLPPDFEFQTRHAPEGLRYIHRRLGKTDLYFVANKNAEPEEALCTFRVSGRRPELWWPDTGRIERPAVFDQADGRVRMPLRLGPAGSVFVVFREETRRNPARVTSVTKDGQVLLSTEGEPKAGPVDLAVAGNGVFEATVWQAGRYTLRTADRKSRSFEVADLPPARELSGPWELSFAPGGGAPERVTLERLISWSDHPDPGVKYFSGHATYRKTFDMAAEQVGGRHRHFFDLGSVQVMAEVTLNGRDLGILWKPPFRVEISGALKAGENALEVKVVNLWVNRMIGDEQLPEDSARNPNGTLKEWPHWLLEGRPNPSGRYTFTSWRLWKKDSPLQESGLLGPVRIVTADQVTVPQP